MGPLVSCLCVTNNRPAMLRRAVELFRRQDYSPRELVIVHPPNDAGTVETVRGVKDVRVRLLEAPNGLTLGGQRNFGVTKCIGDYVCIWDDDDWYREDRVGVMLNRLLSSGKKACVSDRLLLAGPRGYHLSGWRKPGFEGSIIFERGTVERYADLNKDEDLHFAVALEQAGLLDVVTVPDVYVYCFHGGNCSGMGHYDRLVDGIGFGGAEQVEVTHPTIQEMLRYEFKN